MAKLKVGDKVRTTGRLSAYYEEANKIYLKRVPRRNDGSFPYHYCDAPPGQNGLIAVYHEPDCKAGVEAFVVEVSKAHGGHPDTYAINFNDNSKGCKYAWYDDNELEKVE